MKQRFFKEAKLASFESVHDTAHIGAVIVKNNEVINAGYNKLKTHPKSNNPWFTIHAELDSILGLSKEDLLNSDIYIYREDRNGNLACCKPCQYCQKLIASAGIKNVYYTDNGQFCNLRIK